MKRLLQYLIFGSVVSFVLFWAVGASGGGAKSGLTIPDFTVAQVSAPSGANWITHNGNVQAWRYSTLSQINGTNGGSLKLAWSTHLADPTTAEPLNAANESPIVYNGIAYVQDGWMRITALDGASGKVLWQFDPKITLDQGGSTGWAARSIGMGDGLIVECYGPNIVGLNAQTGAQVWATQLFDPAGGGAIDVSPLYYKGLFVFGSSGGDAGATGLALAVDAKTGKVKWHYSMIPSNPKAFGWNTWPADRAIYGGAAVWDPPSIDPAYDLAYFGTGQPLPFNGMINAPGAETGTNGVYALNALTGKFAWWFQMEHHEMWDHDNMMTPTAGITITHNGQQLHVVDSMNKTGYNFILDGKTGKPVLGVVETPTPQDALSHTYPTQPIPIGDEAFPQHVLDPGSYNGLIAPDGKPYYVGTYTGPFPAYNDSQYVVGTGFGAVNWPEGSYDPKNGVVIECGNYNSTGYESPAGPDLHPVIRTLGFGGVTQLRSSSPPNALRFSRLVAINPANNTVVWKHDDVGTGGIAAGNSAPCHSPVITTASNLTIIGRTVATSQYPNPGVGMIQAYDTKTGAGPLWQIPVLVNGQAIPIEPRLTLYSVGGKEYIVSFSHFTTAGADVSAYTLP
jgi:glucose dehydrogenase